jgi:FkbM family methyltransferase
MLDDILEYNLKAEAFKYENVWYRYDSNIQFGWIEKIFNKNDKFNIIDIGAYDGGDSLRYKLYFTNANVYAIEANPLIYNSLKEVEKYGIKTFNYAITNENNQVDFYPVEFKNTYKSSYGIPERGCPVGSLLEQTNNFKTKNEDCMIFNSPIKIQGITLDTFCDINNINSIGFVHADIEGAGKQVIIGMKKILPILIWIEIHNVLSLYKNASTEKEIEELLYPLNYTKVIQNIINNLYLYRNVNII